MSDKLYMTREGERERENLYLLVEFLDDSAVNEYAAGVVWNKVSLVNLHLALLRQQLHLQVQVEQRLVLTQPVMCVCVQCGMYM